MSYRLGLVALANSLHHAGFVGTLCVFTQEETTAWVDDLAKQLATSGSFQLVSRRLPSDVHGSTLKPYALEWALANSDFAAYFDPDIVVIGQWGFFQSWIQHGVALVEDDTYPFMPADHPFRMEWRQAMEEHAVTVARWPSRYYNSGFVGVMRGRDELFVKAWKDTMEIVNGEVGSSVFKPGSRASAYYGTDQDALNMAVMATPLALCTLGPDGMGFRGGGFAMLHAIGSPKPWNKPYVRHALRGEPPSLADKGFWNFATVGPICPYSSVRLRVKRLELLLARGIGRFIRRA